MTVIIGLKHEGDVYIAGDRATVDGWNNTISAESKVFRLGEFLIGTCGSRRMAQLLHYRLNLLEQDEEQTPMDYLVNEFADGVRVLFANYGVMTKSDDGEDKFTGALLFGYRGNLYRMGNNFQIDQYASLFDAIGSGAPFALGVLQYMYNTLDEKVFTPRNMLLEALTAAADLCADVSAPFDIEVLKGDSHAG